MRTLRAPFAAVLCAAALCGIPAVNAAPDPHRIQPGISIGSVRVGAREEAVTRALGTPTGGDGAAGHIWSFWRSRTADRWHTGEYPAYYELNIESGFGPEGDGHYVRVIRAESPYFRTAAGIGPGVRLQRLRHAYPALTYIGKLIPDKGGAPNRPNVAIYDDARSGIVFEVVTGSNICSAVLVHRRGTPVVPQIYSHWRFLPAKE